jgi:predicted dehydrogenase
MIFQRTTLLLSFFIINYIVHAQSTTAVRICVARITHDHVGWILSRNKPDVTIVGIYEPDNELAQRYAKKYNLNTDLFYTDLSKMLDVVKPEAVVAFGSILEHMQVVEACAPRHINVMVEKPLATNLSTGFENGHTGKKIQHKIAYQF